MMLMQTPFLDKQHWKVSVVFAPNTTWPPWSWFLKMSNSPNLILLPRPQSSTTPSGIGRIWTIRIILFGKISSFVLAQWSKIKGDNWLDDILHLLMDKIFHAEVKLDINSIPKHQCGSITALCCIIKQTEIKNQEAKDVLENYIGLWHYQAPWQKCFHHLSLPQDPRGSPWGWSSYLYYPEGPRRFCNIVNDLIQWLML